MVKKLLVSISLILLFSLTACSQDQRDLSPPELKTPVSETINFAKVKRGTIEQIRQYPGIVRVTSEHLDFGNTSLRFDRFDVMVGDSVRQGQILARLDTESIDRQLRNHQRQISRTREAHEHENNLIRSDLAILQAINDEILAKQEEARDDFSALSRLDMSLALNRLDIKVKELELKHTLERQELNLRDMQAQLGLIRERLNNAVITAPYDGVITWLAPIPHREHLSPFQTVVAISDEKDIFIEIALPNSLLIRQSANLKIKAIIGEEIYDLNVRELSTDERSFYTLNSIALPNRFDIINPDFDLSPGAPVIIKHYVHVSEDTLMIPANCIFTSLGETYVYVNNSGTREKRVIRTGIKNRAFIEVTYGLEEGEEVFVR